MHHLDAFVAPLLVFKATPDKIWIKSRNYAFLTNTLEILWHKTKDFQLTVISAFGIEIEPNFFTACLSHNKLHSTNELATEALNIKSIMLLEI